MWKIFKKTNKAFTLIETLVAISIFSLSVLGLMSVLASGLSNITYAKRKMTADYLAQEGIEYIRNMRDTYVLYSSDTQTGWNAFNVKVAGAIFPSGNTICATTNGCYLNTDGLSYSVPSSMAMTLLIPIACTNTTCSNAPLLYDSGNDLLWGGKYNYTLGTQSGFIRTIKVNQISANETRIFSIVSWQQGSGTYNTTFSEDLFNWVE